MQYLSYIFWPRPPQTTYDNPKVIVALVICGMLVLGSFAFSYWRKQMQNVQLKKLSRSWSSAAFWYGLVGLLLTIARTEDISYVSMRFWWIVWGATFLLYLAFQVRFFRARYYQVLPTERVIDEREKYLPKRKK